MDYYVYILQSLKDGKYYIGHTHNVTQRLAQHNNGEQKSTRHRTPFKIVYHELCSTKALAMRRERQIKSYKGGNAFKELLGINE